MSYFKQFTYQDGLIINDKESFVRMQDAIYENIERYIRATTAQYGVMSNSLNVKNEAKISIANDIPGKITFRTNAGLVIRNSGGNIDIIHFAENTDTIFTWSTSGSYYIHARPDIVEYETGRFRPGYKRQTVGHNIMSVALGALSITSNIVNADSILARFSVGVLNGVSCCTAISTSRQTYLQRRFDPYSHKQNNDFGTTESEFYVLQDSASIKEKLFHKNNLLSGANVGVLRIYTSSNISGISANVGDRVILFSKKNYGFYEVLSRGIYHDINYVMPGQTNPVVCGVSMNMSSYPVPPPGPNDPIVFGEETNEENL